jgi:hypothetical protein
VFTSTNNGVSWSEEQLLTASDASENDKFGSAVSVYDNTIVVGSPYDNTNGGTDSG